MRSKVAGLCYTYFPGMGGEIVCFSFGGIDMSDFN